MTKSKVVMWSAWLLASVFYAFQYIVRVMPSVMMPDLMQQFHVNAAVFGQFSGVYYIGYAFLHIPIGILLDRVGPRKVMTVATLFVIVGMLPMIFAQSWTYPIFGRFLIGVGSSASILGVFKIVRLCFSEAKFTRMLSFSVTIGLLGAIYGDGPVSYLSHLLGYVMVMKIVAVMGLLLAAMMYWVIPEVEQEKNVAIFATIQDVMRNKQVMITALCAGLMVGPLEGFADIWGPGFFQHVYGISNTLAASFTSLIFVGMCFGAPVLSYIGEKSKSILATIIGAGLCMLICFCLLLSAQLNEMMIMLALICIGIASAYQILAIYQASTYVKEQAVGLTTAITNMIIMSFGYFFHSTIGMVVSHFGGTASARAYELGVMVIPAAIALAIMGYAGLMRSSLKSRALGAECVVS